MFVLIIIGLLFAVLLLPMRHAFGVNLAATFLFIVPNGFDITTYLFLLLFVRLLVLKVSTRQKIKYDKFIILFVIFLFFSILSYLLFQGEYGVQYLRRFSMTIIIILLFVNIFKSIDDLKLFINYFLAGILLLSIHLLTQTLIPINPFAEAVFTAREGRLMPRGFTNQYVNPNNMGSLLVWGFGLVLGFYNLFYSRYFVTYSNKQKFRIQVLAIAFLINISIIIGMLGSRANFIVLLIIAIILLFKLNLKKKSIKIIITGYLFYVFIGPVLLNSMSQISRLAPNNIFAPVVNRLIDSEDEIENSSYSRNRLASNGISLFLQSPILGIGIGNEANIMGKNFEISKVSHNTYVSLLSEMGVIGILFLIAIIFSWIPYFKTNLAIIIIFMIGTYATFHNIMLMSIPWLIMSFTKRSLDLVLNINE
ncbi:MAG TPA: hypothetical protein DEO36_05110 [Flavobacteriaceae bacterium]|jgi:O-antigen ligase|nr:hypothetical protein [Flavobacteriaceae bacterium]